VTQDPQRLTYLLPIPQGCPTNQFFARHEIQNPVGIDFRFQFNGKTEFDGVRLRRIMGIRADGNPAARLAARSDEVDAHMLAIRIRIDLDCLVQLGGDRKDMCPVGNKPSRCPYITVGRSSFFRSAA
jgi:hypothetical protein